METGTAQYACTPDPRTHAISEADEHIAAAVAAHTDPWPQAARVRTDEHDRPMEQATRLARPHQVTADGDGSNLAPKVSLG